MSQSTGSDWNEAESFVQLALDRRLQLRGAPLSCAREHRLSCFEDPKSSV